MTRQRVPKGRDHRTARRLFDGSNLLSNRIRNVKFAWECDAAAGRLESQVFEIRRQFLKGVTNRGGDSQRNRDSVATVPELGLC